MRVIVADDEEIIRTGVVELIPWERFGYEVVGDAEDGEDALALIQELRPDVVITDIKMPFLTGIDLLKEIKKMPEPPYTILLTGYDEFKFAQEAVNNGAYAYLLKPIEPAELEKILSDIKADYDKKQTTKGYLKELSTEACFKKQLFGLSEPDDIARVLREYGFEPEGLVFSALIFEIDDYERLSQAEYSDWIESAKALMFEAIRSEGGRDSHTVIAENRGFTFTIVTWEEDRKSLKASNACMVQAIRRQIADKDISLTVAAGGIYAATKHIRTSYEEAIQALSMKFIVGQNRDIFFDDFKDRIEQQKDETLDIEDIAGRLSFESREAVTASFDRIIDGIRQKGAYSALYLQLVITNIYICALQMLRKAEVDVEKTFGNPLRKYETVLQHETVEERVSGLKALILEMYAIIESGRQNAFSGAIAQAEAYIMDHFSDKDLSLSDVTKHIAASQAHFCVEFKKKTGETFIDYLTRIRMEKARELLTLSDRKVYEVSEMVGYDNATYFSTLFKKYYNVSPTELKNALKRVD